VACAFIDVDGTIFRWGTEEWLPGVLPQLRAWLARGNQVIFVTQRADARPVARALRQVRIDAPVIANVQNPRVLVNDQGAASVQVVPDAGWAFKLAQYEWEPSRV